MSAKDPLGGEKSHLRIVRDRAHSRIRRQVVPNTAGSEPTDDLRSLHELDRRPKGIADGASQQAAVVAAAEHRFLRYATQPLISIPI
jgi:hypothetical protein